MYGELLYKPWELNATIFLDVVLALKGLRNKDYVFESIMRRVAAAVVGSGSNKKLADSFNTKFWPDANKKRGNRILDPESPQAKLLRRFKVIEAGKKLTQDKKTV